MVHLLEKVNYCPGEDSPSVQALIDTHTTSTTPATFCHYDDVSYTALCTVSSLCLRGSLFLSNFSSIYMRCVWLCTVYIHLYF